MIKIGLVIPCYNEETRLPVSSFMEFAKKNSVQFLFVNDGSRDRTLDKLKELALNEYCDYLDLPLNQGKAEAVRQGMMKLGEQSDLDYIGFWDADLATPLEEIDEIIEFIGKRKQCDALLCSRWLRLGFRIKRNPVRHYLGRVFATVASLILKLPVYDTQCGAKLFTTKSIPFITKYEFVSKWFFDIEILFRLKKAEFQAVWEYPVTSWEDIEGTKLKLIDFAKVPLELFRINNHYNKSD